MLYSGFSPSDCCRKCRSALLEVGLRLAFLVRSSEVLTRGRHTGAECDQKIITHGAHTSRINYFFSVSHCLVIPRAARDGDTFGLALHHETPSQ